MAPPDTPGQDDRARVEDDAEELGPVARPEPVVAPSAVPGAASTAVIEATGGEGLDDEFFARIAVPLYEEVAEAGRLEVDDPRLEDPQLRRAFAHLVRLGLLADDAGGYVAVDPAAAHSAVVAPLGRQGLQLLAEATAWARSFASLGAAWRKGPAAPSGPLTEVRGEAMLPFLASIVHDAEQEVLAAQPEVAGDPATIEQTTARHVLALERGVQFRLVYQHAARRHPATHGYVAAVTARGAEARTLDELFDRVIVVDRKLAVVPGDSPDAAVVIREPSVVAYLARSFERSWKRARVFEGGEERPARIGAEQRAMTIRMLLAGLPDVGSAKRLGVSPRTYAAYVAELKNEFGVGTRFQLGYEMGRRRITGDEECPETEERPCPEAQDEA